MVSSIHILMLTISFSSLVSLTGLTNGRSVLTPEFFSPAGVGAGPFVRLLFKPFELVLVLGFIFHVRKRVASNITVPQLVGCSGAGFKSDY